jgi:hypothetical protein
VALTAGAAKPQETNADLLSKAEDIQKQTEERYKQMLIVLADSESISDQAMQELAAQKRKLDDIHMTVDVMNDGITRANKLVRYGHERTPPAPDASLNRTCTYSCRRVVSRRIASDRFIQFFFLLNFGLLVAIIVWYAVKKGKIKTPHYNIPSPGF